MVNYLTMSEDVHTPVAHLPVAGMYDLIAAQSVVRQLLRRG